MNEELRVADDLFLIALDDRTGQHVVDARTLGYGLAGALLIELLLNESVRLVEDHLRPADKLPEDAVTHRIFDLVKAEEAGRERHGLAAWLKFVEKTAIDDVYMRLRQQRLVRRTESRRLLGGSTVRYEPTSDVIAASIGWRPQRLAVMLGARRYERGIKTAADAALAVLCHAIGLTQRVLKDADGPEPYAYLDEIHRELARSFTSIYQVAAGVGELAGSATFTNR